MSVKFTNRIRQTYYLREGKTKKGKPSYFFSTKQVGKVKIVMQIPDGYEIYEHPENAQVFFKEGTPSTNHGYRKTPYRTGYKQVGRNKAVYRGL